MGCGTSSYEVLANELPAVTPRTMQEHKGQLVRLVGHVAHNGKLLLSPLTGRQCVCYATTAEERRKNYKGKPTMMFDRVASEKNMVAFLVTETDHDGTVHAAYIPDMPQVVQTLVHEDAHSSSGFLDDANQQEKEFLARHGQQSVGGLTGLFNRDLRFHEAVFEPGELVAVIGMVAEVDTNKGRKLTIVPVDQKIAAEQHRDNEAVLGALSEVAGRMVVSDWPSILKGATVPDNHQPQPLASLVGGSFSSVLSAPAPSYGFVTLSSQATAPVALEDGRTQQVKVNLGR